MQPANMSGIMLNPKQEPEEGKIAFAAVEPGGGLNYQTTANGHGFWFNKSGGVVGWGNESMLFVEFTPSSFIFSIGQYPGKCKKGDQFVMQVTLIYTNEGKQYKATLQFNVTIT